MQKTSTATGVRACIFSTLRTTSNQSEINSCAGSSYRKNQGQQPAPWYRFLCFCVPSETGANHLRKVKKSTVPFVSQTSNDKCPSHIWVGREGTPDFHQVFIAMQESWYPSNAWQPHHSKSFHKCTLWTRQGNPGNFLKIVILPFWRLFFFWGGGEGGGEG